MTNDANDNRPERPAGSPADKSRDVPSATGGDDSGTYRRLWDESTKGSSGKSSDPSEKRMTDQKDAPAAPESAAQPADLKKPESEAKPTDDAKKAAEQKAAPAESTSEPEAPKGTPTPGHQKPVGRREDGPEVVSRPLLGTTPKATNEPPVAPEGSGSAPTTPRPVPNQEPEKPVAPPPFSREASAAKAEETAERPANPFAPIDEPERKSRFSRPRKPVKDKSTQDTATAAGASMANAGGVGDEPAKRSAERRRRRSGSTAAKKRAPLGGKNVAALTVAGVALVAVVALIATSALWWLNREDEGAVAPGANLTATPGPVLSAGQMLSESMAKAIDPSRSWSQTLDQAGVNDASPNIACIGPLSADQPIPKVTQLRGLSASGDDRTAALHRADAYATAEEAQKVFEFRSSELGSCTDTPLYVENGLDVEGIGDQSLGVRLVLQDEKPEYHSVVLVRTGRIVNLLDVARMDEAADMKAVVTSLGQSINRQCGPAVGLCTAPTTSVEVGVPPAGGEQPGFLTSGDIPRVTPGSGTWRGNPPASQIDVQDGSGCEAVDFGSIGGTGVTRTQRTYLLRNDAAAPPQFGIDEVALDLGSAEEATDLVNRVSDNIRSCGTRTLTSTMDSEAPLLTPGEDGVEIRGNWFVVSSRIGEAQSQKYRVGIFSADDKVIYLRSNPTETFDFTDNAWIGVNLRAGERITQLD